MHAIKMVWVHLLHKIQFLILLPFQFQPLDALNVFHVNMSSSWVFFFHCFHCFLDLMFFSKKQHTQG